MTAAQAATSVLFSGEMFDARIGLQYLRARWYDAATGRFNQLDTFFGDHQDPLSLHKYLYVHGDPINGIDPTGTMFAANTLAGASLRMGLTGMSLGAIYGAVRGGVDTALDPQASWGDVFYSIARGAILGGAAGFIGGALMPFLLTTGPFVTTGALTLFGGYGLYTNVNGIYDSFAHGRFLQGIEHTAFSLLDLFLVFTAVRGVNSAGANAAPLQPRNHNVAGGDGVQVPSWILNSLTFVFRQFNVITLRAPRNSPQLGGANRGGLFEHSGDNQRAVLLFAEDATWYEVMHEFLHAVHWVSGRSRFSSQTPLEKEQWAYDGLKALF